jgi:hypothetical protein
MCESIEKERARCERLERAFTEVKTKIIDNPVYSSQMAQATFKDIARQALSMED